MLYAIMRHSIDYPVNNRIYGFNTLWLSCG